MHQPCQSREGDLSGELHRLKRRNAGVRRNICAIRSALPCRFFACLRRISCLPPDACSSTECGAINQGCQRSRSCAISKPCSATIFVSRSRTSLGPRSVMHVVPRRCLATLTNCLSATSLGSPRSSIDHAERQSRSALANKPKALSTSSKRKQRTSKTSRAGLAVLFNKTPPCPPVASRKLTLVVAGASQPVAFGHNRYTS